MTYDVRTACVNLFDFGSAIARCTVFIPLYAAVKTANKRNIAVPHRVTNAALHGQRKARNDLKDIVWYYSGN